MAERIDIVVTERGSRVVKRNLDTIGASATVSGGAVRLLATSLSLLGGALVLRNAVQTMADFGQAMSTVRAIAQATQSQFVSLRTEAARLGSTTRFTATQAAEGMLFLARAGFDTNEILGSITGTLQLAQAGALDLGRAADIASNILQGFRLEITETARVVDVLALAANSSNTNVQQLGDAMKFVAPIAAGLGVSIEETTAGISALSNAGLQGSIAGTGLRRVLAELETPGKKTRAIFDDLGVSTESVRTSSVGLIGALRRLRKAGIDAGLSFEIFGQRGGPAFEVLVSSIPDIARFNLEFQKAGGTVARIAAIMDDNLNGALLRVKSAAEAVTLAVGAIGADSALTSSLNSLAFLLRALAKSISLLVAAFAGLAVVFAPKIFTSVAARLTGVAVAAVSLRTILAGLTRVGGALLAGALGVFLSPVRLGRIAFRLFGITGAATALTAGLTGAAFAARLLGRALVYGAIIEGIFFLIRVFKDLNAVVQATEATWGDAAAVASDRFVNTVIGAFLALGRVLGGLTLALLDPVIAGFSEVGNQVVDLLLGRVSTLEAAAAVGRAVANAFTDSVEKTIDETGDLLTRRYVRIASDAQLAFFGEASRQPRGSESPFLPPIPEDNEAKIKRSIALTKEETRAFNALRDELDPVGAARRRIVEDILLLNKARASGLITQEQQIALSRSLHASLEDELHPMRAITRELVRSKNLRNLNIEQRRVEGEVLRVVDSYRLRGITLTEREIEKLRELYVARNVTVEQLQRERQVYGSLQSPLKQYEQQLEAITAVLKQYPELWSQAAQAFEDARLKFLDSQTDFGSGIQRGLIRLNREFTDTASLAEQALSGAFRRSSDVLTEFLTKGKASFKDFINSLLEDLVRLAAKQFLGNLFAGVLGGIGGSSSLTSIFGFRDGGLVQAMQSGGLVRGQGTGRSDSIPARLSNNEFVVNSQATRRNLPELERINSGAGPSPSTYVYVIDQRTDPESEAAEVEQSTGPNGEEIIRVIIRDTARELVGNGDLDRQMHQRYNLKPALG